MGLTDFKAMNQGLLSAFPDLHFTMEDQIIVGDKYTTRWIAEGTNAALSLELP